MPDVDLAAFIDGWALFRDPALAGALMGLTLGLVGVYVVIRHLVFLSATLSQASSLGVALAFLARGYDAPAAVASPTLGAALLSVAAASLFARSHRPHHARDDALLGMLYLVGAAGTLAVGTRIAADLADIQTLLFGTAVAVLPEDLSLVVITCVLVLALHAWWWRGFAAASTDPIGSRVRKLPVRMLDIMLFMSLALTVSVCTRVLGALPAFAFSVLPALGALQLARNLRQALVWAGTFGAVAGFGGYVVAFLWALPVGASQTLVGALTAAVAWGVSRILRPPQQLRTD